MTTARFRFASSSARLLLAAVLAFVLAIPAHAQDSESESDESCPVAPMEMADASTASDGDADAASDTDVPTTDGVPVTTPTPAVEVDPATNAETAVQAIIRQDGVHVVHFWAPWCSNAKNELKGGWASLVESNPNVTFTFVSIWNNNAPAPDVLSQYDIPDRVTTLTQPDLGPSDTESQRRRVFLGVPVTWSPSTWIFHENGELAFAMNYGEMDMETIQTLLDATRQEW